MRTHSIARVAAIALLCLLGTSFVADEADAAVGRTEMAYGVTPNGAVSYTIPIRVTDGIADLTPSLAISYVGPGSRSVLGVGFALSGFSYITPCRKTIVQDLNAAPVTLTSADRFCLDGARLRLVTGTYGADGAIYRTELDQLVRVTSFGAINGIPGWFRVEMPNGLEYEYGNSANSKLLASGTSGAPPQFWAVNKISDPNGNSIVFHYDTDNSLRRFRPNYISYTERGGTGHYRISFVYQTAAQSEPTLKYTPKFGGGAAHSDDKLLDRIELSHDLTVYRKYLLAYGSGAGSNKRLTSVQECVPGAPDDCLPATTMAWQSATAGHNALASTSKAVAAGVLPLDINGDGIEDLVWAASGTWRYMLGGAAGFGPIVNTSVAATNPTKAKILEWNGDGFLDLLIDWSDGKWRVLRGGESGFNTIVVHAGTGGIPSTASGYADAVGDLDADGRDDLITMQLNAALTIYVRFNGTNGFGASTAVFSDPDVHTKASNPFIPINGKSAFRWPDFNGDGRVDLIVYGCIWEQEPPGWCITDRWFQLLSSGTTFTNEGPITSAAFNIHVRYGDLNADGLTDIIYPATTGTWNVGFGQGSGGFSIVAGPSSSGQATYQTLVGDYDGDGYDDLYVTKNSPFEWQIFRGTATGLNSAVIATTLSGTGLGWMLVDQNGDSLPDIGRYDSGTLVWSVGTHQGLPGERLTMGVDGLGNAVSFSYLPMTDNSVYTKGSGAVFPNRDAEFSSPLVRTMQVAPGGGTAFTLTFTYSGARTHAQGRAFLGMASRTTSDSRNTMVTTETFRQDYPHIGAPANVTVKQSAGGNTIQDVIHSYNVHVLDATAGNERYLPYRTQTVTKAFEVGGIKNGFQITEMTEAHTVNTFGNSTFVSITAVDKDSGSQEFGFSWKTEITSTFKEDMTNWCIAAPTSRSEKRILPDLSNQTRLTNWTVSGLECRVTQETIEPGAGSAISLVTDVGYDSCGNLSSISGYPAGVPADARTTTIGYGTRCQSPESITNPLNQSTTIEHNWPLNSPSRQIDPNGIYVDLEYDGFGRLTRRINPDLTASRFALTACDAGNGWCGKNSSARVKVTQTARSTADVILRTDEQFLDGFGRARWSHSDSLESGPAIVETLFDAFGRPTQQTQPYFGAGAVYSTTYARDLIGRVTQVNAPVDEGVTSGRITGFSYEGRELRVTDPKSNVTTRRSNAIGQLRAVVDPTPGGTTLYAYKPFGEIASITDAASNVTSWSYNVRGLMIGTADPDSGSWSYVPNAFGEMTSQTDARSQVATFTYDKLSRPLTRIEAEGTTTWTWGTSAASKNIGRLASIVSPGSYSEVYAFDSLGRLAQQNVTADGTNYQVNLSYVATTGLLNTLEYPTSTSGYRLKLAYDYASNLLKRVRDFNGSTTFWEAVSSDAFGHVQLENFGNGVQTFTDFDQASGLMAAREGGLGGGTGLIHSQVAWDLNGNLTQRKDLKLAPSVTENFYYDALNRFDYSQRAGDASANDDVALDAIGNLTDRLGVGSYDYTTAQAGCSYYSHAQPRAVRKAGSTVYCYDANGNMTKRAGSTISYTSYNLPSVINLGSNSSALSYGAYRNRFKQVAVNAGATETTIYVAGLLEQVTRGSLVEYRHLIAGANGTAAIHTRRSGGSPASDTVYVHTDHLGSPELFTNASGGVLVRPSFTAYGARRDGSDWLGPPSSGDLTALGNLTRHGFTGHEHLDAVGLIHMNGRVYDSVAGRFLSRDPFVNGFGSSQGINGYAYVRNNPLKFVDPTGFCDWDATTPEEPCHLPEIGGECDWGGPWMAGWSELCRQQRDEFWGHVPFPTNADQPEDAGSGGGSGGESGESQAEALEGDTKEGSKSCGVSDFLFNAAKALKDAIGVSLAFGLEGMYSTWNGRGHDYHVFSFSFGFTTRDQLFVQAVASRNVSGYGPGVYASMGPSAGRSAAPLESGHVVADYAMAFAYVVEGFNASVTTDSDSTDASVPILGKSSGGAARYGGGLGVGSGRGKVNVYTAATDPLLASYRPCGAN